MAKIPENFNAEEVDPRVGFNAIPAGKYLACIVESEEKDTKDGKGKYLQFKIQVIHGPSKGSHLWARLNIKNKSEVAVQMARAELSAICRATGKMKPLDSVELHNLPMVVDVKVTKYNGEDSNEIKGYEKAEGVADDVTAALETETATAPKGGKMPWQK